MMEWSQTLLAQSLLRDPTVMLLIVVLGVGAFVACMIITIRDMRRGEDKRVEDRLMGVSRKHDKSDEEIRKSLIKKRALAEAGSGMLKSFSTFKPVDGFQKMCFQADLDWNAAQFLMRMSIVSAAILVVLFLLTGRLVLTLAFGLAPLYLPVLYVAMLKKRRLNALVDQLPEVFDAIVQALRAGQSLPNAIGLVAEQLPEPSRTEFSLVYQEQNLGVRIDDALGNMRNRLDQMDVSFFVTAVQIQRQSGGDLAEVLDNIGSIIRARIKLFGQVRALTAEGRLSGIILTGLPPFMLVVMWVLNPEYVGVLLFTDTGRILLMVAAGMCIVGLIAIRKIVQIEV